MNNTSFLHTEDSSDTLTPVIRSFSNLFYAIDDQCQQYLFYPPLSHQNAIMRIRNAALMLALFTIHNPENQTIFLNNKIENNRLSFDVSLKLLKSILAILNRPRTPFAKLKETLKLLSSANLNPHKLLVLDKFNDATSNITFRPDDFLPKN